MRNAVTRSLTGRFRPVLVAGAVVLTTALTADAQKPPISGKLLLSTSETVLGQQITYPTGSPAHVTAAIVTLQPGAETGLHRHDVPVFGYVLEGELTVTYSTGHLKVLGAGDAMVEAQGVFHNGQNTSSGVTKLLVLFAGAKGVPNSTNLN